MEYPDRVTVYHKLSSCKDDHFLLDTISAHARTHCRLVAFDPGRGG